MPLQNLFVADLTTCTPKELQQSIVSLALTGIEENFRLDFKEKWNPDKQCPDIAAFANSYGGLLILGVADDRRSFPGISVPQNSDLKTQLASTIATRISPVPVFEIHTCPTPNDPKCALVLIRVSPQSKIHLYLKGERPVYVRNEDQTIPAKASELQALLDRVRAAEPNGLNAIDPVAEIAREFYVSKATDLSATYAMRQQSANRQKSETFWEVAAAPERSLHVGLDSALERQFTALIFRLFPSLAQRRSVDLGASIAEREDRARSWYRYNHLDLDRDHEIVWALNDSGVIQAKGESSGRVGAGPADLWSLVDFFDNVDSTLRLVHGMWTMFGYYGAGRFVVTLSVPNLTPTISCGQYYPSLFYGTNKGISVSVARKQPQGYEVPTGRAEVVLSYDARGLGRAESIANIGNQVLRDLRFVVDMAGLRGVVAQHWGS
jgi:hypothetical protein